MNTEYNKIEDLEIPLILRTDSYKLCHSKIYEDGMTNMFGYMESRGGEFNEQTVFGLQYMLSKYFSKPITMKNVEFAAAFAKKHGEPFDIDGWTHIVNKHGGYLPVRIRAIKEGTIIPTKNVSITVESTDPEVPWIENYLETLLVRVWYPSTIAIKSRESKKVLKSFLEKTADDLSGLDFSLCDFGSRGLSSSEQAQIGGASHLLSFKGSDTIEGILLANHYYNCDMAGYSIIATEHSNVSSFGKDREFEFYHYYVDKFLINSDVNVIACVSDTYSIYNATNFWSSGEMYEKLKNSKKRVIIRPDSGSALEVLPKMLEIIEKNVGSDVTVNSKGYKVLPSCLRIIQGDGININTMTDILNKIESIGWSTDNIAFGSGGGLLMSVDRDTQKFAFKCSQVTVDGKDIDVFKDPITDPGKRSKSGRLDLIFEDGEYKTVNLEKGQISHEKSVLQTVYDTGKLFNFTTFEECRERMAI